MRPQRGIIPTGSSVGSSIAALVLLVFVQNQDEERWSFLWREALEQKNKKLRKDAINQICRTGPRAARVAAGYLKLKAGKIPAKVGERIDSC